MADRIIQIIPAPNDMFVKWEPADDKCEVDFSPVACLALKECDGGTFVVPMAAFEDGCIEEVTEFSNFGGIVFAKDPHKDATDGNKMLRDVQVSR